MPEKIKNLMDKYWNTFGEGFPLYQAPQDWGAVEYDVKKCLREGKRAQDLKPNVYGATEGRDY